MSLSSFKKRSGQAIVLLLTLVLAMAALGIWVLDIHHVIMARLRTQDSGDTAALAAARWQAAGLNLCGELNLIQAYMLADSERNIYAAQALHELRLRVQLTTPILAAYAAQVVAEKNDMPIIPNGTEYIRDCRDAIRLEGFYEGAEEDLRQMLTILTHDPIRAVPMSGIFDDNSAYNMLVDELFYEAILSRNWCWFYKNPFVRNYRNPSDFGPLPKMRMAPFFDLRLSSLHSSLDDLACINTMSDQLKSIGHPAIPPPTNNVIENVAQKERYVDHIIIRNYEKVPIQWTIYNSSSWDEWTAMHSGELPIRSDVQEAYDYDGATVAVAVQKGTSSWLATAKPFGTVNNDNPTLYNLTLGGFDTVRLIPVDAADVGIYEFNFEWLNHLRHHLQPYVKQGVGGLHRNCRYCSALRQWEKPDFRHGILTWLAKYGHTCRFRGSGPDTGSGGTRFGH